MAQTPAFRFAWQTGPNTHPFRLESQLADSLARRHVVLLDISVWNRLADGREEAACSIRDKLIRLKNREKVFCPLTPPTIWELRKQAGISLHRTAELMEELSENVTFRPGDQLASAEIDAFLTHLVSGEHTPLGVDKKFSPALGYLAPAYELINTTGIPPHITDLMHSSFRSMRLTSMIRILGDQSSPHFKNGYHMSSTATRRREVAGNSIDRARRIEKERVARRTILPLIKAKCAVMEPSERALIFAHILGLPKNRRYHSAIEHMLRFMPMLLAEVEVMTLSGMDITRQDSTNDFFDRELLIYAMSYSGTFAAIDKWIASLVDLSRREKFPAIYAYAGSIAELDHRLDAIH